MIVLAVMLLSLGAVAAEDNMTVLSADDVNVDTLETGEIESAIDDSGDGDSIQLEAKTYSIEDASAKKHIMLNKSLTFEGVKDKTIIESGDTVVYFDTPEPKDTGKERYSFWRDGYKIRDTGKSLTFNNITFKNFRLVSWHDMTFNDCTFIGSNITNYEKNSTFTGCVFNSTVLTLTMLEGMDRYSHSFTIDGCTLYGSAIESEYVITEGYLAIVGGARFFTSNEFSFKNSSAFDSKMNLQNCEVRITASKLLNTDFIYWSSTVRIGSCEIEKSKTELSMSKMYVTDSNITRADIPASAGYFSIGSEIHLENSNVDNTKISMIPNSIYSQKSRFSSRASNISNTEINTTDAVVVIENTKLNNTHMLLFFTDMAVKNSTFFDYKSIADAIKTKDKYEGKTCLVKTNYTIKDSYIVNATGRYLINVKTIQKNTLHKLTVTKKKVLYFKDTIKIKLTTYKGKAVPKKAIYILDLGTYDSYTIRTDKNGVATFKLKRAGKYSLQITYKSTGFSYRDIEHETVVKLNVKKIRTTVKAPKVTHKFKKSKYFKVTVKNKVTKKVISNVKVKIKVYTGKKYKTYTVKTSKKGIAKINTKSLKKGKHKVVISSGNKNYIISKKSMIKIKK